MGVEKIKSALRRRRCMPAGRTLMNSYHTLCRPFFFSYMRYSVRQASSDSLLVVSSSAIACKCQMDGHSQVIQCGMARQCSSSKPAFDGCLKGCHGE